LQPVTAALLQIAGQDLDDETSDGADEVVANTSAEAMDIAATRVDAKSGIFLDNMRQSVQRGGEIYLSMSREVYFEPGRNVETMSEDGDDGQATLHQPYTDPATGAFAIKNDFSQGKYKVIVDVTEATATRRDKTVKSMLSTAEIAVQAQDMELAQVAVLTAVMNQDGEGMGDMRAYVRKRLVGMGVIEPNEDEQAQLAEAAQNQQPDPQSQYLSAKAQEAIASAGQKKADTVLKVAQATAIGGPEQAPSPPDGLDAAHKVADIRKKNAEADNIEADTRHMPQKLSIEAANAETNRLKAVHDAVKRHLPNA
jgi:hypothetical protein